MLYRIPSNMVIAGREPATLQKRDQTLRTLLRPGERMWIIEEQYDAGENVWRVDVVRPSPHGIWLRGRYKYDVQRGILYFNGERPVRDEELEIVRKNGRVLYKEV